MCSLQRAGQHPARCGDSGGAWTTAIAALIVPRRPQRSQNRRYEAQPTVARRSSDCVYRFVPPEGEGNSSMNARSQEAAATVPDVPKHRLMRPPVTYSLVKALLWTAEPNAPVDNRGPDRVLDGGHTRCVGSQHRPQPKWHEPASRALITEEARHGAIAAAMRFC